MKKFTVILLTSVLPIFNSLTGLAQNKVRVKDTDISLQAENTTPLKSWVGYTRNAGTLNIVQGPGNPPSGCGSMQFSTPLSADKAYVYNYDHNNTLLSSITALSYATYLSSGNFNQVPSINIEIDMDGPSGPAGKAVLVFEPVYNTDQGAIVGNTWQIWDAFKTGNARWWSAQAINGLCAFSCYATWNEIITNNPQATISGGFGVNQGTGNPGLFSAIDELIIGKNGVTTTYNFQPKNCNSSNVSTFQLSSGTSSYNTLKAYPNPTTGEVNVQVPVLKSAKADIVITDASGLVVESRNTNTDGQIEKFDLSGKSAGLYLINVISPTAAEHYKILVQ